MPRKFPEAVRNMPDFKEMRETGIGLGSKLVIEHKFDQAKDIFMKLLEISPEDIEVMSLHANIYLVEGKLPEVENRLNHVLALNPDYPLELFSWCCLSWVR